MNRLMEARATVSRRMLASAWTPEAVRRKVRYKLAQNMGHAILHEAGDLIGRNVTEEFDIEYYLRVHVLTESELESRIAKAKADAVEEYRSKQMQTPIAGGYL